MCEPASRRSEPRVASLFLRATAFFVIYNYLFIYLFIYLVSGVLYLTLTFSSVNGALGRRNTSFRFSFVREIPRK